MMFGPGTSARLFLIIALICAVLGSSAPALAVEPDQRDYWPTRAWEISRPSAEGMDETQLLKALSYIVKKGLDIRSLLVVRNGFMVFENYYGLGMPDRAKTVHSVTKSIMSTLIGLALDQKILPGLDARLSQLLPEYFKYGQHREKAGITLRQLLTMTAGFQPVTTRNYSHMVSWYTSPDRVSFTLNLPQLHEPGKKFAYCNATSHLLSVILTKKSGMDLEDYAKSICSTHWA
jgi:CubicO group peptidase (beta-lactamase class C family)